MARQPQPSRGSQARRPRLPGLGQDDHCPAFRRQFVGLLLGCGLAGLTISRQQGLRRRLASTSVTPSLPPWSDQDRTVQPLAVPRSHSHGPSTSTVRAGALAMPGVTLGQATRVP